MIFGCKSAVVAIESLHSLTNDIARIVDLAPSMAGGNSMKSLQFLSTQHRDVSEIPV